MNPHRPTLDPEAPITRAAVLGEQPLADTGALVAGGRARAREVSVGRCAFLDHHRVASEHEYKRRCIAERRPMFHAQVGYRDLGATVDACARIHERLDGDGASVDRYGICLDWSMGYPLARRAGMPRGTGLILERTEDFACIGAAAPVAPHFGDFVIGTPAALENTVAALAAGSTVIGNLGQYFTFRLPHWDDDVETTARSVEAIALIAAQPVPVLVHSNLDDGFAALFGDLACALGAVLIERRIVTDLLGARIAHCFGHTCSDPLRRIAFQRALAAVSPEPGTMVYGNTTAYGADIAGNYAALATYLGADALAQRTCPSGHALNPVPVTEALRIPAVDEIVDAQRFARRLVESTAVLAGIVDERPIDRLAARIREGGERFAANVFAGLEEAGFDTADPFELLLALRRIGARRLEREFGPGESLPGEPASRRPVVASSTLEDLDTAAAATATALGDAACAALAGARVCVASTDVHEYGKLMVEAVLDRLGVHTVDGGVAVDPEVLARIAEQRSVECIALGTYNGVALEYVRDLERELRARGLSLPVFVGGKLNQVPEGSNTSLPVDVGAELRRCGATPCASVSEMVERFARLRVRRGRRSRRGGISGPGAAER